MLCLLRSVWPQTFPALCPSLSQWAPDQGPQEGALQAPEPKGEGSPHLESKHPCLGASSTQNWGGGWQAEVFSQGKAWDPETRTTDPADKKTGCLDHRVTVASGGGRGH